MTKPLVITSLLFFIKSRQWCLVGNDRDEVQEKVGVLLRHLQCSVFIFAFVITTNIFSLWKITGLFNCFHVLSLMCIISHSKENIFKKTLGSEGPNSQKLQYSLYCPTRKFSTLIFQIIKEMAFRDYFLIPQSSKINAISCWKDKKPDSPAPGLFFFFVLFFLKRLARFTNWVFSARI